MSFIWPMFLGALILVPVLGFLYYATQRRRRRVVAQSGFAMDMHGLGTRRKHLPAIIFLFGIAVLLFSLARPQATVSLPKYEGTVMLVVDVSGSMAANDVSPTRMELAKAAAKKFVEDQPAAVQVGIVAFSDAGLSVQAPSSNRSDILAAIERLVPRRGTSLGNGILVALNAIAVNAGDPPIIENNPSAVPDNATPTPLPTPQGWYPSSVIVLFSDGENNQNPDPITVTDLAVDLGVRIYTVGVGTTQGTNIKVDGMNIHTQLDEATLQQIASTAGGQYYYAADNTQLRRIYSDLKPTLSIKPQDMELTSLLAGAGIVIFLIGGTLSLLWFGRVL